MKLRLFVLFFVLLWAVCACALADVTVPDGTTVIEEEAFMNNRRMSHVALPDGLTRIESKAFYNCGLSTVYLPSSLTYIANDAFSGNSNLKVVAEPGTYAYNWADGRGYIKNEPAMTLSSREISVASNDQKSFICSVLAPEGSAYVIFCVDGEMDCFCNINGRFGIFDFPVFGGIYSVGNHTVQFRLADENWNVISSVEGTLRVTQGPNVTVSLYLNTETVQLGENDSAYVYYDFSVQNAGIQYMNVSYLDSSLYFHSFTPEQLSGGWAEGTCKLTLTSDDFPENGTYTVNIEIKTTNGLIETKTFTVYKGVTAPAQASAHSWLTDCYIVEWSSVPGATGYDVYYSPDPDMSEVYQTKYYESDGSETYTAYINTTPGQQYYFEIYAYGANCYVTTGLTDECVLPMPAPENFTLTGIDAYCQADLSWDGVAGGNSYRIYFSGIDAFNAEINTYAFYGQPSAHVDLTDWGFGPGDTAYLWVAVQTDYGPGLLSDCLAVTIPSTMPELSITDDPVSQTVEHGDSVTMSVTAAGGTGTYSYQWYRAKTKTVTGTKVSQNRNYTFFADSDYQGYYYYCVVTSGAETVTSAKAKLTFTTSAVTSITILEPEGGYWYIGDGLREDLSYFVETAPSAVSPRALNYYSTDTSVATVSILSSGSIEINMVGLGEADIVAKATNGVQDAWHVRVVRPALAITDNPVSQTVEHDDTVTMSVSATGGTGSYAYQWYRAKDQTVQGVKVSKNRDYTFTADSYFQGYYYYCVVTSGTETVTSAKAKLTFTTSSVTNVRIIEDEDEYWYIGDGLCEDVSSFVETAPSSVSPRALNYYSTDTSVATVSILPSGSIDINMVGLGEADIVAEATSGARDTWHVRVINPISSLIIASDPDDQTAEEGESVSFQVIASGGSGNFSYQWYRASSQTAAGTKVGTSRKYTFTANSTYNGYYYYCVVTSGSESATSSRAKLTVYSPTDALTITSQPVARTAEDGAAVAMSVSVSGGTGSYAYQWYRASSQTAAGTAVSTSRNYSFTASSASAGYYYCVVTSGSETVTSSRAKLTISQNSEPAITGGLTKTSYTVAQNGKVKLEGYVEGVNCSIGVISVSVMQGSYQALTKSYSSQGTTYVDLSDIFTIDPAANSEFSAAKTYSIAVYAKAYGSSSVVNIGEATVKVTAAQTVAPPSISVALRGVTYTAERNANTGIWIQAGSAECLWPSVTFSSGLDRLEVAVFDAGGHEKPVICSNDWNAGVTTGKTGNFVVTGNVDEEAPHPYSPGFYFPEDMASGEYWLTAIAENSAGRQEIKIQFNVSKTLAIHPSQELASRFAALQSLLPTGKYWNHHADSRGNILSNTSVVYITSVNGQQMKTWISTQACSDPHHSWEHYSGGYNDTNFARSTCNACYGEAQCIGFANLVAWAVGGKAPTATAWKTSPAELNSIAPGDMIWISSSSSYGHKFIVLDIDGDIVHYADCNGYQSSDGTYRRCQIRWDRQMTMSQLRSKFLIIKHFSDYAASQYQ